MTQSVAFRFVLVSVCLLLNACSDYEFKFNDRTLFTPTPLFSKYRVQDRALSDCVRQTILDQRISEAEDLQVLVCTNAGIASLAGLATFTHIEQLNLGSNAITDIQQLALLPRLTLLDLSDNMITDITLLEALTHLEEVRLTGNPALNCAQVEQLHKLTEARIYTPEHCD